MSTYGAPPPPPPPYGGQPPYPGQPYPGGVPAYSYAHWGKQVGAFILDGLIGVVTFIPGIVGMVLWSSALTTQEFCEYGSTECTLGSTSVTNHGLFIVGLILAVIGYLFVLIFGLWNTCYRQGKTGQSLGKRALGISTVKETTGQPLGGWLCFGRQLLHILDSMACYLGWLWPLWDTKRQTFADKIVGSVVINGTITAAGAQQQIPGIQQY